MKKLALILIAGALLWLSGCAMLPPGMGGAATMSSPINRARILCAAYASTIVSLGVQNRLGNLSEGQEATVDAVRLQLSPFCKGDVPRLAPADVLTDLELQLATLIAMKEGKAK